MQVIREVVSRLSVDGVDLIGKCLYEVGQIGGLMEMIMLALSRETERTVDCALQVCYQLARKAGSLYLPLMSRNGIMRMIGTISQVLQLPKYDFRVVGRGRLGGCKSDAASNSYRPHPICGDQEGDGEDAFEAYEEDDDEGRFEVWRYANDLGGHELLEDFGDREEMDSEESFLDPAADGSNHSHAIICENPVSSCLR